MAAAHLYEVSLPNHRGLTSSVLEGLVLGLANVIAVGLALGMSEAGHGIFAWVPLVLMFGAVPGLVAGAVIGAIAHANRGRSTRVRQLTLVIAGAIAAMTITFGLGMVSLGPVACIPTVFAALALERWTRTSPR